MYKKFKSYLFTTGCTLPLFTFLKCSWASRSFFLRAAELDSSWFQRFIKAACRASMAFDWTCLAASSWSLRAVMLVMPSCWKAWRPASNVSCKWNKKRKEKVFKGQRSVVQRKGSSVFHRMQYLLGEQSLHRGQVSAIVISLQAVLFLTYT